MKKLMMIAAVLSLAACSSPAQRMADCQSKRVSKDACYIAEQNRTTAINAAAENRLWRMLLNLHSQRTGTFLKAALR